jgi:sugar O-acyltransferase (sialic acid O-acetyltransferase NeuD family)
VSSDKDCIVFGFSHFLGDIIDCIEAGGGALKAVVLNVPETPYPGRLSLRERLHRLKYKVPVFTFDEWYPAHWTPDHLRWQNYVIGFSGSQMKPLLGRLKELCIPFEPLVHQTAILQKGAAIGAGAIVNAGAIVGPWARIGEHTILNRGCTIGHDCVVGPYGFVSPGATLCSHVTLGENVKVGANATILPDVQVGSDAVIGAGAVVLEDVPAGVMVAGVPAVVKKEARKP